MPFADFSGGRAGDWTIPASTVDAALYQCGVSVWYRTGGKIGLPKSLGRLVLGRFPNEGEACRLVCRSIGVKSLGMSEEETFRFALFGADGQLLFRGDDYVCQILTR